MKYVIKLAIDAMGGDYAPKEIVEGCLLAIQNFKDLELVLYGNEQEIKQYMKPCERISIVHAPDKLDMGEKDPIGAIRRNKELSLVKAFSAVHDKECQGAVTAGPTQGVVVCAHIVVRKIEGMKRVAICPQLPEVGGKSRLLLDSGANTSIKAEHILQHALFASIFYKEVRGVEEPLVGLINIGTEPGKGRDLEKEVYQLLENDPRIHFYGNVEPKELLSTPCDILVSDGFSGNLVMKSFEGAAKSMGEVLKEEIKKTLGGKIGYLFMHKNINNFKKRMSADEVGGSLIFGVDGIIVKAHGSSQAYAFSKAIELARKAVLGNVIESVKKHLTEENE